jgi:hypothetical protein
MPVTESFRLSPAGLLIDRVTTKTSEGKERTIKIDRPEDGTEVGDSVQVKGSETIAAFENTLAYHIYDEKNQQLAEGSFQVTAAEPGGPATFDTTIDLTKIPSGAAIWLQIIDLSPADGATLALDTVKLVHK